MIGKYTIITTDKSVIRKGKMNLTITQRGSVCLVVV